MDVILTKNHEVLGNQGDVVNVSSGYARNFLFPHRIAMMATEKARKHFIDVRSQRAKKIAAEKKDQESLAQQLNGKEIIVKARAGAQGKLYGSVTSQHIAEAIKEHAGITIERRRIRLSEAIKSSGTYEITLKLFHDVSTKMKIKVEAVIETDSDEGQTVATKKRRKTVLNDFVEKLQELEQEDTQEQPSQTDEA